MQANGGSVDPDYDEVTQRNIGLLTQEEQARVRALVVAVAGCGGVGASAAHFLARLGVGELRLADPETFEPSNINRQLAAYVDTIGRNKAEAVAEEARRINPRHRRPWSTARASAPACSPGFLDGADAVVDALDFWSLEVELELHAQAAATRSVGLHQPGSCGDHHGDGIRPVGPGARWHGARGWNAVHSPYHLLVHAGPAKAATPELLARAVSGELPSVPLDVLASSFEAAFLVNELVRVTVRGLPRTRWRPTSLVFDQDEPGLRFWDGARSLAHVGLSRPRSLRTRRAARRRPGSTPAACGR